MIGPTKEKLGNMDGISKPLARDKMYYFREMISHHKYGIMATLHMGQAQDKVHTDCIPWLRKDRQLGSIDMHSLQYP